MPANLPPAGQSLPPALKNQLLSNKLSSTYSTAIADPQTDLQWGLGYLTSQSPHSYFDYYFTGQDINIYIDGAHTASAVGEMPIIEFGVGIQQQKQPVYGFWSYSHDVVMRGTRIVNGMFRIATKTPHFMADMIALAAVKRIADASHIQIRGLDIDEQFIATYWTQNFAGTPLFGPNAGLNVFNSHPPFDFILEYMAQTATVYDPGFAPDALFAGFKEDTPTMTDTNERLAEFPIDANMQYIIKDVEITGLQTEFSVDGQVCSEVYTFFARDMYCPTV